MVQGCSDTIRPIATILGALYLPGLSTYSLDRSSVPKVLHLLRASGESLEDLADVSRIAAVAAERLESGGVPEAALILRTNFLVEKASRLHAAARFITVIENNYPQAWIGKLRRRCPPAVWTSTQMPSGPFVAIVGGRRIDSRCERFVHQLAADVTRMGFTVISGGAMGVDRMAAIGATSVGGTPVAVLPSGLAVAARENAIEASVCRPGSPFTTAAAMERNRLVFAAASAAIVVACRYGVGGTWHATTTALRERLTTVYVPNRLQNETIEALIALGARPLPKSLGQIWESDHLREQKPLLFE